jgi:hypothetical protein
MKFNSNGSIVTATYALLLLLALETLSGVRTGSVSTVKFTERIVLWTIIVLVTVATITCMIRRRRFEPLGLDAAFRESAAHYFGRRTTKSGAGGAKPAVTTYSELPNSAIVVGTFVAGFDANGSVM